MGLPHACPSASVIGFSREHGSQCFQAHGISIGKRHDHLGPKSKQSIKTAWGGDSINTCVLPRPHFHPICHRPRCAASDGSVVFSKKNVCLHTHMHKHTHTHTPWQIAGSDPRCQYHLASSTIIMVYYM